jgi:hypothetical protein
MVKSFPLASYGGRFRSVRQKAADEITLSEMPLVRQHRIRVSSIRRPPLLNLSLSVRGYGRGLDATHVRDLVDHLCVLPDD